MGRRTKSKNRSASSDGVDASSGRSPGSRAMLNRVGENRTRGLT